MKIFDDEKKNLEKQIKEEIGKVVVFIIIIIPCIMTDIYLRCVGAIKFDSEFSLVDFLELVVFLLVLFYYLKFEPCYGKCFIENYTVVECKYRFKSDKYDRHAVYFTNINKDTDVDIADFQCYCTNTDYKGDLYFYVDNERLFNDINDMFTFRLIVYKKEKLRIDAYTEKPIKNAYYSASYIRV